jgi:hypothetical protein
MMPNGHPEEIKSRLFEEIAALRAEVAKLRKSEQTLIDLEVCLNGKLDRLREALKWACDGLRASRFRSEDAFVVFRNELRRKAGEG